MYVYQSVIAFLLIKIRLTMDIFSSGWAIFLKFTGDIPGMFLHLFKMIWDFLYVCQSLHGLTSLLKLMYQWYLQFWMRYLPQIFWRHPGDVCTLVPNNFRFLVCLSVCSLPKFLTEIWLSSDIFSSGWDIFAKFSGDISGIFVHYFKVISDFLYVCWSVHCLTSLLKLWYLVPDELFFQIF